MKRLIAFSALTAAMALPAFGGEPAGLLQTFLDTSKAYNALPVVKRTPAFRLEPVEKRKQWYYICDGDRHVGLIGEDVQLFDKEAKYSGSKVDNTCFADGARLCLTMGGYHTEIPRMTSRKLTITKDRGDSIEFKHEQVHPGGYAGSIEFRVAWDERLGHVIYANSHFIMPEPKQIEFNNFMAGWVSDLRDRQKRWQKTVRGRLADGRIVFVHHSPVNLPRDEVQPGGFLGFVTEERMNPFAEMLEASGPVYFDTCSVWYDQHMVMRAPQAKQSDGMYHLRARYRLLSVPASIARELEAVAVDNSVVPGANRHLVRAGFLLNKVNDFENFVPSDRVYNGAIFQHIDASEGEAHSGKYSLALHGPGPGKVKVASPVGGGPPLPAENGKSYRLAAWVKTKGLKDGGAYLEVSGWRENQRFTSQSEPKLAGDHDWTRLQIEFGPMSGAWGSICAPRAPGPPGSMTWNWWNCHDELRDNDQKGNGYESVTYEWVPIRPRWRGCDCHTTVDMHVVDRGGRSRGGAVPGHREGRPHPDRERAPL